MNKLILYFLFNSILSEIEKLNSSQIIYKIIFNSTPDKFLKIMQNANFKIDTSKDVWKLQ